MSRTTSKKLVLLLVLSLGAGFLTPRYAIQANSIGIVHATVQLSVCGNNTKEAGEQCDGTDLGGRSCSALGYDAGAIGCSFSCEFDTSSCTTSATAHAEVVFSPSADRTYILPDGLDIFSIFVPQEYYTSELTAYLFSHDGTDYTVSKPFPSGTNSVGKMYDIRFVNDEGTIVHQLSKTNTLTLTYDTMDLSTTDESTIAPYRSEDGENDWQAVPDYTLNTSAKTVSFATKDYSLFALFGLPVGAHTDSGGGGGGGTYEYPKLTQEEKKRIIKIADFNKDNRVDIEDLSILLYYYGISGKEIASYDLNKDKTIDILDVSIMLYYWSVTS